MPESLDPPPPLVDLVGAPDVALGAEGQRASAALRRLARREDLKAAVIASPYLYPVLRRAAARYVAGQEREEAIATARDLAGPGHHVTIDHMGEDTRNAGAARAATDEFLALVDALESAGDDAGPMRSASVSLDLSHIGLAVPGDGPRLAAEHLAEIAVAAGGAGREVMISMEGSERTADVLRIHAEVTALHPTSASPCRRRCIAPLPTSRHSSTARDASAW
jgi:proline dehydrogenase